MKTGLIVVLFHKENCSGKYILGKLFVTEFVILLSEYLVTFPADASDKYLLKITSFVVQKPR